jgi:hypothetical protein
MEPIVGISDDYASCSFGQYSFYYGYEEVCGEDDDWCFVAKFNGNEIKIPGSKIGLDKNGEMSENVLTGILWLFAKYDLKLKPKFQSNDEWLKDYE